LKLFRFENTLRFGNYSNFIIVQKN
jgi:hypothetical protein